MAVDNFLRAAGIFKHIHETFTNAPSVDLKQEFLEVLVALMLAQARECLYEKLLLQIETFSIATKSHVSESGVDALANYYLFMHLCGRYERHKYAIGSPLMRADNDRRADLQSHAARISIHFVTLSAFERELNNERHFEWRAKIFDVHAPKQRERRRRSGAARSIPTRRS